MLHPGLPIHNSYDLIMDINDCDVTGNHTLQRHFGMNTHKSGV